MRRGRAEIGLQPAQAVAAEVEDAHGVAIEVVVVGDASLDESIRLYERGDRLRAKCAERLDAAQARIEAIRLDAEGKPQGTRPFAAG